MYEEYKPVMPYLPSPLIAKSDISDCLTTSSRETTRINDTIKEWVSKGVLVSEKSFAEVFQCLLKPEWTGTYQFSDKKDQEPLGTRPTIAWSCQPHECSVEADLPVPVEKETSLVKALNDLEKCCVHATHTHEEGGVKEKHVHVICKGIYPDGMYATINNLARLLLEHRGHEKAMQEWKEFR